MCRSGTVDLICVDSVSALTPRAEIEGEIGMKQMGLQARLMSQALQQLSGNASKAGCTLIFLNQIRYKIGVFYGSPEVTSGSIALKFFASHRLEIRPIGKIKTVQGEEDIGLKVCVRVQKSKPSVFLGSAYRLRENPPICSEIEKVVRSVMAGEAGHANAAAFGQWSALQDELVYKET
ncbi:DNA repair protein recA homolog 1, chloroplastic-like [Aristolochia californica]|uniref:DNA repair protein recA homolog 1, chloroplastic-like n=1 Tax=Aristolochia californica TaxID=171875 RepID=UPI0035DC5F2C